MKNAVIQVVFALCALSSVRAADLMSRADSLFQHRDFDAQRLLADTTDINRAITLYMELLENGPDEQMKSEALWKLLQAFYYKGQFGTDDKKRQREIYSCAIGIGEKSVNELPQSAAVYCWLGILWARWAEVYGTLAAARKGVAGKVKRYGEKSLALDEKYLDGGAYRILGMLHFSAPNIPLLLNWPSKEQSLHYLERAYAIAPHNLYNKLYLAQVLQHHKQHDRAEKLLREIIDAPDIVHDMAIDAFLKRQAADLIAEHSSFDGN